MGSRSRHVLDVSGCPLIPYARNSKPRKGKRKRISVEEQDFEIRDHCEEAGETLYDGPTIVDRDHGAAYDAEEREGWKLIMQMVETGQYGGIAVRDADRAARDGWISEQLIHLVRRKGLKGFRVVSAVVSYDLSTQRGVSDFRAAIDAAERELMLIRSRTAVALKQKAIAGEVTGGTRRIFGWIDKYEGVKEDSEAAALADAHKRILEDSEFQMADLVNEWADEGIVTVNGLPFTHEKLKDALLRPSNAGLITAGGKVRGRMPGEPIVDEETHHAVVAHFASVTRGRPPRNQETFLLSRLDIIRCPDCKSRMHGGRNAGQPVYICSYNSEAPKRRGCRRSIQAAGTDAVVTEKVLEWWKDPARASRDHLFILKTSEEQEKLLRQIDMLDARIEALTLKFDLPADRYTRALDTLASRREGLAKSLEALRTPVARASVTSDYVDRLWNSSHKDRQKMTKAAIRSIHVSKYVRPKGPVVTFQPSRLSFEYW
ncbi:recombinase family protein [Nocardiopsis dassonvillei]